MSAWSVSALCIFACLPLRALDGTYRPSPSVRLSPLSDYYGDSVTLSLSACRSSRVSSNRDVRARFYGVLLSIIGFLTRSSSPRAFQRFRNTTAVCWQLQPLAYCDVSVSDVLRRAGVGHTWTRI